MTRTSTCTVFAIAAAIILSGMSAGAQPPTPFQPKDVLSLRYATSAAISPDGKWVAYTVSVPREIDDDDGARYAELRVVSTRTGENRGFVTGKVNTGAVAWTPDGRAISFRMRRGDKANTQVWTIPIDGGEAVQSTQSKTDVLTYDWHPTGGSLAYTATSPDSKREKELKKKGYGFVYYNENLKHRNLYSVGIEHDRPNGDAQQLTHEITIWSIDYSPDGRYIAVGASEKNLVDYRYMFQSIYLYDVSSGEIAKFSDNPGKLGSYHFSPDGTHIAYTAALTQSDNAVSQVFVKALSDGEAVNLTEPEFRGHVEWAGWKNDNTVVYLAAEGVNNTLSTVKTSGGKRKIVLDSSKTGFVFERPSYTKGFGELAFTGSSTTTPENVYYWPGKGKPKRLTRLNPWIAERKLGRRDVITYKARDGWEIEALLSYPVDYETGRRYPLIVQVHGGPESHQSNNFRTSYYRPVQVLNGRGYFVLLPNYRSSTGYGTQRPASTLGDPAGKEFDDIADGIDYLVEQGMVDPARVGLGGGSYGGFAAAWFASYYTQKVKAVVMFVGISDLISKRGTTDIPYEELLVHSGKKLEDMWDLARERSPLFHARKSRTATLILGGKADPRVSPTQSTEFYNRLSMNDHPAVRLVQYPGEGHGNRKMAGRRDVLYRTLQWYDWYIRDAKPLDGPMPPLDLSQQYGLDLPEE